VLCNVFFLHCIKKVRRRIVKFQSLSLQFVLGAVCFAPHVRRKELNCTGTDDNDNQVLEVETKKHNYVILRSFPRCLLTSHAHRTYNIHIDMYIYIYLSFVYLLFLLYIFFYLLYLYLYYIYIYIYMFIYIYICLLVIYIYIDNINVYIYIHIYIYTYVCVFSVFNYICLYLF
jgi:hypothetical protein